MQPGIGGGDAPALDVGSMYASGAASGGPEGMGGAPDPNAVL